MPTRSGFEVPKAARHKKSNANIVGIATVAAQPARMQHFDSFRLYLVDRGIILAEIFHFDSADSFYQGVYIIVYAITI